MLTPLGSLLSARSPKGTARAVTRALFLLQCTEALHQAYPQWRERVRCQAVVGDALVLACVSSVVLHEVRKQQQAILALLEKQNAGFPIHRLQCLLSRGTVASDEIPV